MRLCKLILIFTSVFSCSAFAVGSSKYLVGFGYFSQNALYHSTSKDSATPELLGAALYPLIFTYSTTLLSNWIFYPQFQWTILPRTTETYSSSIMLLNFPVGKRLPNNWQWYVGPGLLLNTITGKGGIKALNNGTSASNFAVPGRSVQTKTLTVDLGLAWENDSQRLGFGTLMEDFLSTTGKRAYHLYLNWSFALGRGF